MDVYYVQAVAWMICGETQEFGIGEDPLVDLRDEMRLILSLRDISQTPPHLYGLTPFLPFS